MTSTDLPPLLFSDRPSWGDLTIGNKILSIGLWTRSAVMFIKGILFIGKGVQVSKLYQKSYDTWFQFEVLFFFVGSFKILCLMPDVFLYEINWLFYALALNSAMAYTLSYVLFTRATRVLDIKSKRSWIPLVWYGARIFFLVFICATPFINWVYKGTVHYLTCNEPLVYRKCQPSFSDLTWCSL